MHCVCIFETFGYCNLISFLTQQINRVQIYKTNVSEIASFCPFYLLFYCPFVFIQRRQIDVIVPEVTSPHLENH